MINFTKARTRMAAIIKKQGIKEELILAAMQKIPRHLFISKDLEEFAYDNTPLPIGYSQTTSQPYIIALMLQEASLDCNSRVLEVGTGSGYQTAILAEICKEVFTIEILEQFSSAASVLLQKLGYKNIQFKVGDGSEGWITVSPFNAIIVTAKVDVIPKALLHQLIVGGRMLIPLQKTIDKQVLVKVVKTDQEGGYLMEDLLEVRFVPMVTNNKT